MSMRAVLICGGEFCPQKFFVENCDTIVAVDKGYEYIKDIACPQYVVGDFDSLGYVPEGVNVIKHNPIKDYTDTQLAIEFLLEKGYDEFVIHAGLGARLDHTFANLQMAYGYIKQGKKIFFVGKDCDIYFLSGKSKLSGKKGSYFSLFSFDKSEGVTIKNAKYEISNLDIVNTYPLGVSNEFIDGECEIEIKKGVLMAIVNNDNIS